MIGSSTGPCHFLCTENTCFRRGLCRPHQTAKECEAGTRLRTGFRERRAAAGLGPLLASSQGAGAGEPPQMDGAVDGGTEDRMLLVGPQGGSSSSPSSCKSLSSRGSRCWLKPSADMTVLDLDNNHRKVPLLFPLYSPRNTASDAFRQFEVP